MDESPPTYGKAEAYGYVTDAKINYSSRRRPTEPAYPLYKPGTGYLPDVSDGYPFALAHLLRTYRSAISDLQISVGALVDAVQALQREKLELEVRLVAMLNMINELNQDTLPG